MLKIAKQEDRMASVLDDTEELPFSPNMFCYKRYIPCLNP